MFEALAIRKSWPLNQLQFAEDYIDALYKDGIDAVKDKDLKVKYSGDLRNLYIVLVA